jgi:hypothetical protein
MSLSNQAPSYAWQPDNRDTPVKHANRRNRNYDVTHRPSSTVTKETVAKPAWRSAPYTSVLPAYTGRKLVKPYLCSPYNAFTAWTGTPLPYRPIRRTAYLLKLDEPCLEVLVELLLTSDRPVAYLHRTAHTQAGKWHIYASGIQTPVFEGKKTVLGMWPRDIRHCSAVF